MVFGILGQLVQLVQLVIINFLSTNHMVDFCVICEQLIRRIAWLFVSLKKLSNNISFTLLLCPHSTGQNSVGKYLPYIFGKQKYEPNMKLVKKYI